MIKNPMEAIVFPNPSLIVLITRFGGNVVIARKSDTRKSAINAFILNLEVRTIIANMLMPTRIEMIVVFIKILKLQMIRHESMP
jgi:hypothetical protein